ncbi:MAG: fibronectin type III-like domain-contianing protein [Bacteroidales bacterium]|nr:fibronectin type III-like domain-contianing protein [Bacteroidales bacterium]
MKDDWGFTGVAISDWGGARSTVPMANSGLDLEMPYGKYYDDKLLNAIKDGVVTEANREYELQVDFYENIGTCRCKLGFAPYEPGDISPSGKLPVTFPKKWEDSPVYGTYPGKKEVANYKEGIFVGYRHFDKENIEPLFPFGYGLSYTTFEYSDLKINQNTIGQGDTIVVKVAIRNSGEMAGDEIVQLYISDKKASVEREVKSLKGFSRVSLIPDESKSVQFKIDKNLENEML